MGRTREKGRLKWKRCRNKSMRREMRMFEMLGQYKPQYPYGSRGPSFDPYNTHDTREM